MKKMELGMMAACAGLALSAAASGQYAVVSNLPGMFTDISGSGASITTGDDSSAPFTSSVTNALVSNASLYACTNGDITDAQFTTYTNTALPAAGVTLGLFPYWDDLYVDAPGSLTHQMVNENGVDIEVVQWNQVRAFGGTGRGSFEVKIFASGPVFAQYIYQDMSAVNNNGSSATVGMQTAGDTEQYSYNSAVITPGLVLSVIQGTTGACCLPNGTCALLSPNNCGSQGGVYRGDNSPCATANCPSGACCTTFGCVITGPTGCTNQGGTYHGDGSTCANAGCPQAWQEQGDAGDLPATAQVVTGTGPLAAILGSTTAGDVDMYEIQICDPGNFEADTANTQTTVLDTQLFLFDSSGHGIASDDDDPLGTGGVHSRLTSQFIPGPGLYYLAITAYNQDPHGVDTGGLIWANTPFNVERRPDGPAASEVIGSWDTGATSTGNYAIALAGACFVGGNPPPSCYANCDHSTAVPFLNVNDFLCFQTKFAAGDSYANCDHSTAPPVLNVNDFLCFQTMFAAGCSAP